jgi:hypothetical protein
MCPGSHGVGLLDFWSRHSPKEPCPCPSVIPKSSVARCSTVAAGRPIAQIAADLNISDQDHLRLAPPGTHRHRAAARTEQRRIGRAERVVSQRIWRSKFISATATARRSLVPRCWEWQTDNYIGRSPAPGDYGAGFDE